jgi:hypothetical protein
VILIDGLSKNPDAPIELPHPSSIERKIDYTSLDHCQQAGKREDKEMTNSMEFVHNCTKCTSFDTKVSSPSPRRAQERLSQWNNFSRKYNRAQVTGERDN